MGERSFAGYTYRGERGDGFYGVEFGAVGPDGGAARIVHVAERLTEAHGYAEALARFGSDLAALAGDGVVVTRTVGRGLDGTLVVVTDDTAGMASVDDIRASARGQALPYSVALRLAKGLITVLGHAHRRGIAHGAIHTRSILVDAGGQVFLDHFAAGRALASVAASGDEPERLSGFRGFLAPELALAEEPTPRSDVYAVGAVLHSFFGGDVTGGAQPGRLKATTSVRRLVVRAMDTDASRRFATAVELGDAFERAIETDRCELASEQDMILYSEDAREAASSRAVPPSPSAGATSADPVTSADALDELIAGLDGADDDDGDDGDDHEPTKVAEPVLGVLGAAVPKPEYGDDDDEPTALAPQVPVVAAPVVDDVLASLEEVSTAGPLPEPSSMDAAELLLGTRPGADSLVPDTRVEAPLAAEDTGDHSQLTQVDDALIPDRDPISELIQLDTPLPEVTDDELDDASDDDEVEEADDERLAPPPISTRLDSGEEDHTPLPPPYVHESGSFTRQGHEVFLKKGGSSVQQRAEDAIASLDELVKPSTRIDTDFVRRARVPGWVWGVGTLLAIGVMFLLVWTRTDVFHPERAERKRKAKEAEHKAKEAELRAQLKKGGEIIVEADQEGAAVWLRLGRTPMESMPLPAYHPHQIRFELDGYQHLDTAVVASDWEKGRASIARSLVAAKSEHATPPWPPALPESAKRGFDPGAGLGAIKITSTPEQAEVWLLVGYTNSVRLRDFEAGVRYEFKLTKEGFLPGFTVVEPEDWKLGGADQEALRRTVIERIELRPAAPAKPR